VAFLSKFVLIEIYDSLFALIFDPTILEKLESFIYGYVSENEVFSF